MTETRTNVQQSVHPGRRVISPQSYRRPVHTRRNVNHHRCHFVPLGTLSATDEVDVVGLMPNFFRDAAIDNVMKSTTYDAAIDNIMKSTTYDDTAIDNVMKSTTYDDAAIDNVMK